MVYQHFELKICFLDIILLTQPLAKSFISYIDTLQVNYLAHVAQPARKKVTPRDHQVIENPNYNCA